MTHRSSIDFSKYVHSPAHYAVLSQDYDGLREIISELPKLREADKMLSVSDAIVETEKAEAISTAIDRRDVPGRETALHLAVKMRDAESVKLLMSVGADSSLQNEQGWSPLQEAICMRETSIACIILKYSQTFSWVKWCRRLPLIIKSMKQMRDFYLEISFHFESSLIPFITKAAPSDTYKIWKCGPNFRADTTLSGFDGLQVQRTDRSFIFFGDGSADGRIAPGSFCFLNHKKKQIKNALEGANKPLKDADVAHEVALMMNMDIYRPGLDVTQAVLVPQLSWRWQEKVEMVGSWRSKVYEMRNVTVSIKSMKVSSAFADEDVLGMTRDDDDGDGENYMDLLTEDERRQVKAVLDDDNNIDRARNESNSRFIVNKASISDSKQDKKGFLGRHWKGKKQESPKKLMHAPLNVSDDVDMSVKLAGSEFRKSVKPVLWLTPDFPLKTEELLPLLDVLANKVKAVRRLREILTTKLPAGTFPVKIAIPVLPTIRVIVTFTKFEELQSDEEYVTPMSSPSRLHESHHNNETSSSWLSWIFGTQPSIPSVKDPEDKVIDPFAIPPDYVWVGDVSQKQKTKKRNK